MSPQNFTTISLEVDTEGIAVLTLDRPDHLNAFTKVVQDELIAAFDSTDTDDTVRSVVVTGKDLSAGDVTFNYADNRKTLASGTIENGIHRDAGGLVTLRIFDSLKPIVAAINGPAVGVGASMTSCHGRAASVDQQQFRICVHSSGPSARRGRRVVPAAASRSADGSGVVLLGACVSGWRGAGARPHRCTAPPRGSAALGEDAGAGYGGKLGANLHRAHPAVVMVDGRGGAPDVTPGDLTDPGGPPQRLSRGARHPPRIPRTRPRKSPTRVGQTRPHRLASTAKAHCSDAGVRVASDMIQIHGGVGCTWEHPAHLYFRRATSSRLLFGDPAQHRDRLARAAVAWMASS